MQVPENILNTVDQFHREWRHPRLEPLVCSALYSLFPEKTIDMPTVLNWPSQWPNDDRPGVYMIFGAERQLLEVPVSSAKEDFERFVRWLYKPETQGDNRAFKCSVQVMGHNVAQK
jgi:hypothetical protein